MSMSDGDIYVDYGRVNDVEDVLSDCTNAVGRIVDEIQTAVGPMVSTWEGSSQEMYTKVQAKWNADTTDMQTVLGQYAPTLDEMKVNYGTTDNDLALQWSQIS
ncbi:MAG TPA: WXG100 family type VII secretion target [Streptosporangiaceae bacterium]|nr:WXG100 family type VII secretion target [Streptosporangiaceae bacterium]